MTNSKSHTEVDFLNVILPIIVFIGVLIIGIYGLMKGNTVIGYGLCLFCAVPVTWYMFTDNKFLPLWTVSLCIATEFAIGGTILWNDLDAPIND